jgi:hypothetical protein
VLHGVRVPERKGTLVPLWGRLGRAGSANRHKSHWTAVIISNLDIGAWHHGQLRRASASFGQVGLKQLFSDSEPLSLGDVPRRIATLNERHLSALSKPSLV